MKKLFVAYAALFLIVVGCLLLFVSIVPANEDQGDSIRENLIVEIGSMYEQTRKPQGDGIRERWIPNTGEFLVLDDIRFSYANNGSEVDEAPGSFSEGVLPIILGARDRAWSSASSGGNIERNSNASFELAAIDPSGATIVKMGTLKPVGDGTYSFTLAVSPGDFFLGNGELPREGNSLSISPSGELLIAIGSHAEAFALGIRPAVVGRPGDDLFLSFGLLYGGKDARIVKASISDRDYIAVYDKKEMWRANLYIDEGESDWNRLHPWNAPPDANALQDAKAPTQGGNPAWWSPERGYNEWNRAWPLNEDIDAAKSFSISSLPAGDGKQVVSIPSFTPVLRFNDRSRSENLVSGRVSYSIPHFIDGHFDSPFDFKAKMLLEREAIRRYYQIHPSYSLETDEGVEIPNSVLASWEDTTSPGAWWRNYLSKNFVSEGVTYRAFMPGLGLLRFLHGVDKKDSDAIRIAGSSGDHSTSSSGLPYPAGTDCLGFAQRAASYGGNAYAWADLSLTWTENPRASLSPGGDYRSFPRCALRDGIKDGESDGAFYSGYPVVSDEIFTRGNKNFCKIVESPTGNVSDQAHLSRVVPGDIFYWRYFIEGQLLSAHIAIVSDIEYYDDGRVKDILILESTFSSFDMLVDSEYPQYVMKSHRLSDYYLREHSAFYRIVRLKATKS